MKNVICSSGRICVLVATAVIVLTSCSTIQERIERAIDRVGEALFGSSDTTKRSDREQSDQRSQSDQRAQSGQSVQRPTGRAPTPEENERKALAAYETARAYETAFYESLLPSRADVAIENFETYYVLSPNGTYAALALLRKALLYIATNRASDARRELSRLKNRPDLAPKYAQEIAYVESQLL